MRTVLKYVFYTLIIIAIYFLGVGFYDGTLNKDSSQKDMTNHVATNTKEIISEGYQKTKDAVQGGIEEVVSETKENIENGVKEVETETKETIKEEF